MTCCQHESLDLNCRRSWAFLSGVIFFGGGGGGGDDAKTVANAMADWCLISKEIKQKVETSDGKLVLKHTGR